MYSKNYECVIMQVTKGCADFILKNVPKVFGGRALPGPAGGAYNFNKI